MSCGTKRGLGRSRHTLGSEQEQGLLLWTKNGCTIALEAQSLQRLEIVYVDSERLCLYSSYSLLDNIDIINETWKETTNIEW